MDNEPSKLEWAKFIFNAIIRLIGVVVTLAMLLWHFFVEPVDDELWIVPLLLATSYATKALKGK